METEKRKQKMLLAVVQGDDYPETVDALNRNGFSPRCSAPPAAF